MDRLFASLIVLCTALLVALPNASAVVIDWLPIGNADNTAEASTGKGAVSNAFDFDAYDVTNSQYVEFLNTVDANGANVFGLYNSQMTTDVRGGISFNLGASSGSMYSVKSGAGNHPVDFVSLFDAMRFANWLNNGQGSGDTETGAYTLLGGTPTPSNAFSVTRNASAQIFIPSDDEWVKAGYYNPTSGSYFLYATNSNQSPNLTNPTSAPNSVNSSDVVKQLTDVGAYSGTTSPYGAFDMVGNVYQWTDTYKSGDPIVRGSSWLNPPADLLNFQRTFPDGESNQIGFRVAMVPEPGTFVLATLGVVALRMCSCRRRRRNRAA